MNLRSKKILITFIYLLALTGGIVLLLTVFVYTKHSHINWLGDIDKDFFGIFGEFVGGVVGTLFSVATTILVYLTYRAQQKDVTETRKLLQKQIDLSIKPDLFFANSSFYGFSRITDDGKGYALDFSNNPRAMTQSFEYNVLVDLVNIGVGIAKNIEFYWDFDLAEIDKYLNKILSQNPLKMTSIEKDFVDLKVTGIKDSLYLGHPFYNLKRRFDILLPHKENSAKLQIPFPLPYLACYFIGVTESLNRNVIEKRLNRFMAFEDFPKCELNLSYYDISDQRHKKTFDFHLSGHGSFILKPEVDGQNMFGYELYTKEKMNAT